jgi:CRISPR type I-E-associated protein CasA/Cse1
MTDQPPLRFNALTDPWLPLLQADGSTTWASFVEVLTGERDGVDLDYPRDDFRVFGRLLLSALTQALLPCADRSEFVHRLATPLPRSDLEARMAPVLSDFELFGPRPFLQIEPPAKMPSGGATSFVFPAADLFVAATIVDALSLPIALVALFAEHTFAGGAGRGYVAGPAGQPGALTLLDAGSIRRSAWANTLTADRVAKQYAAEDQPPWSQQVRQPTPRAAVGLVTGLFYQPRGIWLIPAGYGRCSLSYGVPHPEVDTAGNWKSPVIRVVDMVT